MQIFPALFFVRARFRVSFAKSQSNKSAVRNCRALQGIESLAVDLQRKKPSYRRCAEFRNQRRSTCNKKAFVGALCRILGRISGPPQVQRLAQSLHLWRCRVSRCGGATPHGEFSQKRVDGSQISPVCGFAAAFFASVFSGTNLSCVWILQITRSIQDRPGNLRRR